MKNGFLQTVGSGLNAHDTLPVLNDYIIGTADSSPKPAETPAENGSPRRPQLNCFSIIKKCYLLPGAECRTH